jgi:uncharacterized protein involved in response to NO
MRAQTSASSYRLPVLFALGFRPFFLLAGLFAVLSIAVWAPAFVNGDALTTYYGAIGWHSHEMVFGYSAAVIAGFLLTAVRNWTDLPTPAGAPLAVIAAVWLLGRIVPFFPDALPGWTVALIDLAFFPALAVAIGIPLVQSGTRRNLIFIPLLATFIAANLLVHLEVLGVAENLARRGIFLGVNLTILLIVIMGGRVIPFFTERALTDTAIKRWPAVEALAPLGSVAFLFAELIAPDSPVAGGFAALAAIVNGVRLAGWHRRRVWRVPLLWVLHLGYGWVVVGYGLKALAGFSLTAPQFTVHAFTVGAIGVLTLGMMARVSLGHTARPLNASPSITVAFALINLAALIRGVLPALLPHKLFDFVAFSGALWITAFVVFAVVYTPLLLQPRIDGRSG